VNDEGPFNFLLDTGTNSTLITPELARRLDLRPTDQIPLITLSGTEVVPRATLDSLALGTKSAKHLEVIFDDLSGVRLADSKICGVLGQNFLSQFNYLINYRERYVEFEESGELERRFTGAPPLVLEQDEGKLVVRSQTAEHAGETLRLVLDSGASHLVIFPPASFRMQLSAEHRDSFLTTTSATNDPVRQGRLSQLIIGNERLTNLPVALILPRAEVESRNEDGLLPTSLFRTIFFQNDRHAVLLNPRAD
ncbi:MAG TPA: aspartyl protease family protein, partial [Pyrinomonadaceae bacterium]|nr:aspartyl protease family protein [Pyrinomonadaceae bacterium]